MFARCRIPAVLAIFTLLTSAAAGAGAIAAATDGPVIVAPLEIVAGAGLPVRLQRLEAGGHYTLRCEFASRVGTIWRSEVEVVADGQGSVDLARAAPASGPYTTADPQGVLWSMAKTTDRQSDATLLETDERMVLTLALRTTGDPTASARVTIWKRRPGVSVTELREPFTAAYFVPLHGRRLPAVVVLGGSEGGVPRDQAALLASQGFATLAVAYFGSDGLPKQLDRVPIETVTRAVEWLAKQPEVDARRIGIVGWSKGAELALLSATHLSQVRAVVGVAPAAVAFQSLRDDRQPTASWTWKGVDVPYAPFVASDAFNASHELVDLYRAALAQAPAATEIPVEAIRGRVLLIAGRQDKLWPSSDMAERLAARSRRTAARYPIETHLVDDAGHHVASVPGRPTADSVRLGGTAAGIAHAQRESWRVMVEFLQRALRP